MNRWSGDADLFIILPQAPGIPDLRRINQDKRDDHKSSKSADFRPHAIELADDDA